MYHCDSGLRVLGGVGGPGSVSLVIPHVSRQFHTTSWLTILLNITLDCLQAHSMWWQEHNSTHCLHCLSAFQACVPYFALHTFQNFIWKSFVYQILNSFHTKYLLSKLKAHLHATVHNPLFKPWVQWVICWNFYWEGQGRLGLQMGCRWDAKKLRESWQTYRSMWSDWRRSFTRWALVHCQGYTGKKV